MTQTAVISWPMTLAIPRASASVASGSRTATTLSKPDSDKRFEQKRSLRVGVLAPCHADRVQPVAARRGDRLGAHHGSGRLLGGVDGADKASVVNRELVLVHRGAVGFLAFDEDEPNGGRRHGQSEHRVHPHPLWDIAIRAWSSSPIGGETTWIWWYGLPRATPAAAASPLSKFRYPTLAEIPHIQQIEKKPPDSACEDVGEERDGSTLRPESAMTVRPGGIAPRR